jgi:hypothetical protein
VFPKSWYDVYLGNVDLQVGMDRLYIEFPPPSKLRKCFKQLDDHSIDCRPPSPIETSVCSECAQFQGNWNAALPEKRHAEHRG